MILALVFLAFVWALILLTAIALYYWWITIPVAITILIQHRTRAMKDTT